MQTHRYRLGPGQSALRRGRVSTPGRIYLVTDSAAPEDLILNANLIGGGRVNFDGTGTVRIGGDNSLFTGGLQMDSGITYVLGNSKVLGTGQLFLNGGTVQAAVALTGVDKLTAPVSLGGNGVTLAGSNIEFGGALTFFGAGVKTYTVPAGQTLTFSGTLDSSQQTGQTSPPNSAIIKAGDGKLVISGTATAYTSTLTVNAGRADIDTALGSGAASIHAGAAVVNISVSQNLADLTIDDGGKVVLVSPLPPAPELSDDVGGLAGGSPIAVPEPGCGMLLMGGLAVLFGRRRQS